VVFFRHRDEYVKHLRVAEPRIGITLGFYLQPERTAYFFGGPDDLAATWRHEATHQLFHETLRTSGDVGVTANFWIVEGVALYIESLASHAGYCTLGGLDADRLQYARYRALNEGFYVPLEELASMSRPAIQEAENIRRLYSQAAGLTHFLMHYDGGRYRPAMIDYLRMVYAGRDDAGSLSRLVGAPLATLDDQYSQFLQVTDDDLAHLAHRRGLSKLSLGHTAVTDAGLAHLDTISDLQWLDLAGCAITDETIHRLRGARQLRELSLEHTKITDAALDTVGRLSGLEQLDLSYTPVTDEGLAQLAGLTKLMDLWLTGTQITDAGLAHLHRMKDLGMLEVSDTRVTPHGVQQLQRRLPSLKTADGQP
jgi:hypothetical protein